MCDTIYMQAPQEHDIRAQIDKILAGLRFKEATRSRRFLEFIAKETLAGRRADLKENIVGVEVFDRAAAYDPRLDSIVRVEAGRLRNKLNDYYEQEGRDDTLIVVLPKGSYALEFKWRAPSSESVEFAESGESGTPSPNSPPSSATTKWIAIAAVVATVLIALLVGMALRKPAAPEIRLAVLPFTPYSEDARDRMLADRLTQKVTAEFVKLGDFNVVPSTSARRYEDRRPGVREIATALQADLLVEARTIVEGNQIRVELRLSDGMLDRKFWVGDKFAGENIDELARQIAVAASEAVANRK